MQGGAVPPPHTAKPWIKATPQRQWGDVGVWGRLCKWEHQSSQNLCGVFTFTAWLVMAKLKKWLTASFHFGGGVHSTTPPS